LVNSVKLIYKTITPELPNLLL